jgi:hypothetical protein
LNRVSSVTAAVMLAAIAGCGGTSGAPHIGRGTSLQSLPLYQVVSESGPAPHSRVVELPGRLATLPDTKEWIRQRPATQLHVTAAEAVDATREGWRIWIYAPEATALFPHGVAQHQYVVVFNGVGYRAVPIGGDPDGLNLSIILADVSQAFAVSMASALTSDVRILQASS